MLAPDYHLHSQFSKDSEASLLDYCRCAVAKGLREIAVTDHLTLYRADKNFGGFDYPSFIEEVERCRLLFQGKIVLKAGIEIDYHPHLEEKIRRQIAGWDKLDFIIGAVHYVQGRSAIKSKIAGEDAESFVEGYFKIMERLVESEISDVLGHFDVFRRAVREGYEVDRYLSTIKRILLKAVEKKMALEINTSGFKHGLNDTFPHHKIVEIFKNCGGSFITIGSDAHRLKEFAANQEKGIAVAKEIGYHQICCYEKRQPYLVPF